MMVDLLRYGAGLSILAGSYFLLMAAIGLLRFPDSLTRLHAVAKAGTLGAVLALAGAALASLDAGAAFRGLIAILFLLAGAGLGAAILGRGAPGKKVLSISNSVQDAKNIRKSG